MCKNPNMKKYLMEFMGTMLFVLIIGLVVATGSDWAPLAIGLGLGVLVYAGSHVSGSHYNPAVTLAVLLRGKIPWSDAIGYWVAQFLGGAVAALVVAGITTQFVPAPGAEVSLWSAVVVEMIFTFILAFVVLQTATTLEQEGNSYFGFAIGLTVTIGAIAVGAISGGAFNPAVGLSPLVVAGAGASYRWIYLVGPMVGGALAAGFFSLIHDWGYEYFAEEVEDEREDAVADEIVEEIEE